MHPILIRFALLLTLSATMAACGSSTGDPGGEVGGSTTPFTLEWTGTVESIIDNEDMEAGEEIRNFIKAKAFRSALMRIFWLCPIRRTTLPALTPSLKNSSKPTPVPTIP